MLQSRLFMNIYLVSKPGGRTFVGCAMRTVSPISSFFKTFVFPSLIRMSKPPNICAARGVFLCHEPRLVALSFSDVDESSHQKQTVI
jgi:hypothetical protein